MYNSESCYGKKEKTVITCGHLRDEIECTEKKHHTKSGNHSVRFLPDSGSACGSAGLHKSCGDRPGAERTECSITLEREYTNTAGEPEERRELPCEDRSGIKSEKSCYEVTFVKR